MGNNSFQPSNLAASLQQLKERDKRGGNNEADTEAKQPPTKKKIRYQNVSFRLTVDQKKICNRIVAKVKKESYSPGKITSLKILRALILMAENEQISVIRSSLEKVMVDTRKVVVSTEDPISLPLTLEHFSLMEKQLERIYKNGKVKQSTSNFFRAMLDIAKSKTSKELYEFVKQASV